MSVFCVDIGNSHTVLGVFQGEDLVQTWRLTTPQATTSDEVFLLLQNLMLAANILPQHITRVGISSVVPDLERIWKKAIDAYLKIPVAVVSSENCLDLPVNYKNPEQVGPDRLANVLALRELGYQNALAVDLGTATTFDLLHNGAFGGGIIIPGIASSLETLTRKAKRLTPVSLDWPSSIIGKSTEDSIRSGLLHGFIGQLEYLVKAMKQEIGQESLYVVGTGGWSAALRDKDVFDDFDPALTLKGIRLVAIAK